MKTEITIAVILLVLGFLFISQVSINIKPFSISLPYWHRALGVVLIVAGCLVYNIGENVAGYKKGFDNGMEIVLKQLKKRYERPGD